MTEKYNMATSKLQFTPRPIAAISRLMGVNCNTDAHKMGKYSPFWRKL